MYPRYRGLVILEYKQTSEIHGFYISYSTALADKKRDFDKAEKKS